LSPNSGDNGVALQTPAASSATDILPHLLLALAAVVVAGRVLGFLFRYIGQPPVIGEVVGGIALGPSLLGQISPAAYDYLLPSVVAPFLSAVAHLGVIVYMFLIGLELNLDVVARRLRSTVTISLASILVPFLLGGAVALYLFPRFAPARVPFTSFALFLGLSMSVTAFPVLARILSDQRMSRSELGTLALACAAINDVVAWCLLALVVGIVHAAAETALVVAAWTAGLIAVMFLVIRPLVARTVARMEDATPGQSVMALVLVGLLVSSWATETIGIHAIFGAFLFGAVVPHESRVAVTLTRNLESLTLLLLPAFFAFTGMRTEIGLIATTNGWLICAGVVIVATLGKFGGTVIAGVVSGLAIREASALGVLMNTRGLMELVVLNVGLDLGIISPAFFTMMVVMALVTTVMTTPLLRRLANGPLTHLSAVSKMTPPVRQEDV
jgi:Kef-type K+ transport system membrane component KefB